MARRSDPDASELRRNQILDAAMSVFARLGFEHAAWTILLKHPA